MNPTRAQAAAIRYFNGDTTVPQPKNPASLDRTYAICVTRGWIEPTDTFPYHQATDAGRAAITEVTAGVERFGDNWEGVIRQAGDVIYRCGHSHTNRDTSSQINGISAHYCVSRIVDGAKRDFMVESYAAEIVREEGRTKYLALVEMVRRTLAGGAA